MFVPLKIYFPYSFGFILNMNSAIFPWKTMWMISSSGRNTLRNSLGMYTMVTSLPSAELIVDVRVTNYRSPSGADASIGSIFPRCFWPSAQCLTLNVLYQFSFRNTRDSKVLSFSSLVMPSGCFGWKVPHLFTFRNS